MLENEHGEKAFFLKKKPNPACLTEELHVNNYFQVLKFCSWWCRGGMPWLCLFLLINQWHWLMVSSD